MTYHGPDIRHDQFPIPEGVKVMSEFAILSFASDFASCLTTVRRSGDFWVSGTALLGLPSLEVDGVGPIALPLLPLQAEQLISYGDAAPFGRGEATIIDQSVRRSWQIGPGGVHIGGRHWEATLAAIVARAGEGLGISDPVDAMFYKLLIYDEGSFFVGHRDTEKVPGMFATLLVALPSRFEGGDLIIRHQGRQIQIDLHNHDPAEAAFAAFYADCVHEVLPVTQGYRLTLVYNLVRRGKGRPPAAPSYYSEQCRLTDLLQGWSDSKHSAGDNVPEKLVYLLEHSYTPAELSFAALKGADAAQSGVVVEAARASKCDLHLALLTIEESGAADYAADYYPSRRGHWPDPDVAFQAGDVDERSVILSDWRRPEGAVDLRDPIPVRDDEFAPPGTSEDLTPDEEHFHEATGNEGASFERTYRRAALVLWPSARFFAVLSQAGHAATLPYLDDLADRWEAAGSVPEDPLWCAAHDLAGHMLVRWSEQATYRRESDQPSAAARMLAVLTRLDDTEMLEKTLWSRTVFRHHDIADNQAIVEASTCLPPERWDTVITQIIEGTADTAFAACANLVARAGEGVAFRCGSLLVNAGTRLLKALPCDPESNTVAGSWSPKTEIRPETVVDVLSGLGMIGDNLALQAADQILAVPKIYDPDNILIPALRRLMQMNAVPNSAVKRLQAACLDHIRVRIAEPLAPPTDWRRAHAVPCGCSGCIELARFLGHSESRIWHYKAAEAQRRHLQENIGRADCDLDLTIDKRGRPYSLVCVKNQASYDRRAKQREQDLADLMLLEG